MGTAQEEKLTGKTQVLLELEALSAQHDHSQAVQAVVVAEAELEIAKLRWRLERPKAKQPVTLPGAGGAALPSSWPAVRLSVTP